MSLVKRVVAYHIARLKDKNPEVRLKAIRELELLSDPDALEPLQQVFRQDPNADIRRAAQEAGRKIFLKNNNQT
ncbi:MAG: HEAT repeat domain-containing protein [Chloroflexota bacterium]